MMEKSGLAGKGRGCTPTLFTLFTITYKVAVYAPAERADTLHQFHLYPYKYSVGGPLRLLSFVKGAGLFSRLKFSNSIALRKRVVS